MPSHTVLAGLRRLYHGLRRFHAEVTELQERWLLLDRPWEEDVLHWAYDGRNWQLHGHRPPPPGRATRSVTTGGWCPGLHGRDGAPEAADPDTVRGGSPHREREPR